MALYRSGRSRGGRRSRGKRGRRRRRRRISIVVAVARCNAVANATAACTAAVAVLPTGQRGNSIDPNDAAAVVVSSPRSTLRSALRSTLRLAGWSFLNRSSAHYTALPAVGTTGSTVTAIVANFPTSAFPTS